MGQSTYCTRLLIHNHVFPLIPCTIQGYPPSNSPLRQRLAHLSAALGQLWNPHLQGGPQKMAPPVSRENRVYSGAPGSIFMPPSGFPKVTTVLFCNTAAKALPVE